MKKILLLSLVLVLLFAFTTCTPNNDSSKTVIKIAFWGSYEEVQAINKIAKKIQKEIQK